MILKIRSTCVHQGGFVQFPTLFGSLRDRKGLLLRSTGLFLLIGLDVGDECSVHCLDSVTIYTVSESGECCSSLRYIISSISVLAPPTKYWFTH